MTEGLTEPAQLLLPAWAGPEGTQRWGQGQSTSDPRNKLFTRQVTPLQPCLENTALTQLWTLQQVFTALLCSSQCFTLVSRGQTGPGASAQSPAPKCPQAASGFLTNPSQTNTLGVTFSHSPLLLAKGQGDIWALKEAGWMDSVHIQDVPCALEKHHDVEL